MVEGDSGADKGGEIEVSTAQNGSDKPALPREPSFSGWFDEDGIQRFDRPPNGANASVAHPHLELALVEGDRRGGGLSGQGVQQARSFRHRNMHLNGGHSLEDGTLSVEGDAEEKKFLPFHIQSDSGGESRVSDIDSDVSELGRRNDAQSNFPIAMVLRTSFFVLIWYIASTFGKIPGSYVDEYRTLYNASCFVKNYCAVLLPKDATYSGDVMEGLLYERQKQFVRGLTGKFPYFPAPEKDIASDWMKDIIFTVQLAKIILGLASLFTVVPTALGTALDINLSNASLVFISVTFATMETEFEFWGFVFVMLAAVMSGFRWSMTQILLQVLTEYILVSETSAVTVTIAGVIKEAVTILKRIVAGRELSCGAVHGPASAISVSGMIFKGEEVGPLLTWEEQGHKLPPQGSLIETMVAVFYFHDEFTWMKGIGLITIMVGVSLFNWYKYQKLQKGQADENAEEMSPSSSAAAKYVILENMDEQEED
ncbi:hypothetical protein ACLOJK_008703 [Asimina triloba]